MAVAQSVDEPSSTGFPVSSLQLVLIDGSSGRMLEIPLDPDVSEDSAVEAAQVAAAEWVLSDYEGAPSEFAFQVSSSLDSGVLEGRVPLQGGLLQVSDGTVSAQRLGPEFDLQGYWSSAQERFIEDSKVIAPDALEAVLVAPLAPGVAAASAEAAEGAVELEPVTDSPKRRVMPAGVRARREQFAVDQSRDTPGYDRSRSIDPPR